MPLSVFNICSASAATAVVASAEVLEASTSSTGAAGTTASTTFCGISGCPSIWPFISFTGTSSAACFSAIISPPGIQDAPLCRTLFPPDRPPCRFRTNRQITHRSHSPPRFRLFGPARPWLQQPRDTPNHAGDDLLAFNQRFSLVQIWYYQNTTTTMRCGGFDVYYFPRALLLLSKKPVCSPLIYRVRIFPSFF